MEFKNYLTVFLGLAVLLYRPAEGADVISCGSLTQCLRYSSSCVSTSAGVTRRICLQMVDNSVPGCGVLFSEGLQAMCVPALTPGAVTSFFFSEVCVDVAPTGIATFHVDQPNTAIATAPTDSGPFNINPIDSGTIGTTTVQCSYLATAVCPPVPGVDDGFRIRVTTEACACTCTAWVDSSACSVTCGSGAGFKTQTRTCTSVTGATCTDAITQTVSCTTTTACPSCNCMTTWTAWTGCSVSCGGGTRTRSRPCVSTSGVGICPAEETGSETCNTQACSSCNCQEWGSWGTCTKTCGGGTQMRMRTCTGTDCPGTTEIRDCNESGCPVAECDIACSSWTVWTPCTATCAGVTGVKTRSRTCPAGTNCDMSDIEVCFSTATCGSDGGWAAWMTWGPCFPECTGRRQRERVCNNPPPTGNGRFCPGPSSESDLCPFDHCPVGPVTPFPTRIPISGGGCQRRRNCRRRCRRQNNQAQRRRCRRRCNQRFGNRRTCGGIFG